MDETPESTRITVGTASPSPLRASLELLWRGGLKDVAQSNLAENAAARMRRDLEESPIDPFYSADWGCLANQVVGHERVEHGEPAGHVG